MAKRWFFGLWLGIALLTAAAAAWQGLPELADPPRAPNGPGLVASELLELEPQAFLPVVYGRPEALNWVDTTDRAAVQAFYLTEYYASEGVPIGWTGNHDSCLPGTTSPLFQQAVFRRINYFRMMAGVPPILAFKDEYNQKAQAAALMMSVNKRLSHYPDSSWECFSEAGKEAAGRSDLILGANGAPGITYYMVDAGGNNYPVGHRRWILYPQTTQMGTGDVPGAGGYPPANALWVIDLDSYFDPRPATRDGFVAWPPPGYLPYSLAFPRWSLSYPGADFSQATVTLKRAGLPIGLAVQPVVDGYGENTLVWEPAVNTQEKPAQDVVYSIQVADVLYQGSWINFDYQVILFDPG